MPIDGFLLCCYFIALLLPKFGIELEPAIPYGFIIPF